jgi:hypothetical protein
LLGAGSGGGKYEGVYQKEIFTHPFAVDSGIPSRTVHSEVTRHLWLGLEVLCCIVETTAIAPFRAD